MSGYNEQKRSETELEEVQSLNLHTNSSSDVHEFSFQKSYLSSCLLGHIYMYMCNFVVAICKVRMNLFTGLLVSTKMLSTYQEYTCLRLTPSVAHNERHWDEMFRHAE